MRKRAPHNPEAAGSSPASATIKTTVFHQKYGGFSNFLVLKIAPHFGLSNTFLTQRILKLQFLLTHHGQSKERSPLPGFLQKEYRESFSLMKVKKYDLFLLFKEAT